ncbi:conjugal transfer protein TraD [Xanthomonas citri]|uniref:conjugal transfer protein TraD n=1 Tax=Xanthomonas citri TaxID=346 RepID=UPI0005B269B6|nr:conjugal transfer protein TraD [Xanthomonas citri]
MALSRTREQLRREDTRHKIELGGLVVKAGLGDEDRAVILGALTEAMNALQGPNGPAERRRLQEIGSRVFTTGD